MKNIVALTVLFLAASLFADNKPLQTVPSVDIPRYLGTWYEIARFPFLQQKDCYNTTAIYSLNEDGTVKVYNRCRKGSFDAADSVAIAKARLLDDPSHAKLKVKFFLLAPEGDYWIIRLGEDYDYAVVSQPSRRYLWILSRTPQMAESRYSEIVKSLEQDGFDVSRLEKTPQQWESFERTAPVIEILIPYLKLLLVSLAMMFVLWLVSLLKKDASIVDRFWGLGFVLLYTLQLFYSRFLTFRGSILFVLVLLWGLRLSVYIYFRNKKAGEDPRYQAMRRNHKGKFWWISLFSVFGLQGTLMWFLASPLIFVVLFPQSDHFTVLDGVGILLWTVGFLFEAIADFQLAQFKKEPSNAGKVLNKGLWALSRHPNYFGEALLWWGYWVICLNTSVGFLTIYSPILMTFLLLKVSGVLLLEKQLKRTKPEYADYIRTVPAFIPRIKK